MRNLALVGGIVFLMALPTQASEFAGLEAAIEGKALCIWEGPPERDAWPGSSGECGSITQVLDVTPTELRIQETTLTTIADYAGDSKVMDFLRGLPVFDDTIQVWRDLDALNGARHPYLKSVTDISVTYLEPHSAYCASSADMLSADATQLYLSSEPSAAIASDFALPPDLNRRVIEAIRAIVLDSAFRGGVRKRGGDELLDRLDATLAGLCGNYLGPSFGSSGVDRWEAVTRDGVRQHIFDQRVRVADSAQELRLSP